MLLVIPVKSERCSMATFAVKLVSKKVSKTLLNYNNFSLQGEENLESVKHATVLKHTFTLHPNLSGQKA